MDSNREEAQRAFKLAQSYETTDPAKSLKFAKKACALYWSPEAAAFVKALENGEGPSKASKPQTDSPQATSSSSKPSAGGKDNLRSRNTPGTPKPTNKESSPNGSPASAPSYKPAQLEIVKKVRRCKATEYYEILDLKRDCEDGNVKTAYRKLALALHPDKNGAPGADEAFKMVSKAFQVLSDPDKRAAFDRHGADPDSRSAGFSTDTPFTRGRTHFANADEGMDADQLFRMFFGGGMGGGMFDGPGVQFGPGPTVFQFGGGMPRVRRTGAGSWAQQMHNQRARQADDQQARAPTSWVTFMPIIIFFVISLLQSFPSLFSAPRTPDPTFSWGPSSVYPVQRVTLNHAGVKYFVNPNEFGTHPFYEAYLTANPQLGFIPPPKPDSPEATQALKRTLVNHLVAESASLADKRATDRQRLKVPSNFRKFEQSVETMWVRKLQSECHYAREIRDTKKRNAMGFLGIGADWETIKKLDAERIMSCEGLRELGYVIE